MARDDVGGLVAPARAASAYGVVPRDGIVDAAETAGLRRQLVKRPGVLADYDFGSGRAEWERVHGLAAELIADFLPTLNAGVRRYAQARVYQLLHDGGPESYDAPSVRDALAGVSAQLGRHS